MLLQLIQRVKLSTHQERAGITDKEKKQQAEYFLMIKSWHAKTCWHS